MPRLSMSIPCTLLDNFFDLQKYNSEFDKLMEQLPADVNKYEI